MEAIQTDRPGYWAVIPATVRYDDKIPPNAKLLYGEISALTGKEGYCYASNRYFANLYGSTETTIGRLLQKLETGGYIRREVERGPKGNVVKRMIFLTVASAGPSPQNCVDPPHKNVDTPPQNCGDPPHKNVIENNINIINKKEIKKKKANEPLSDDELREKIIAFIGDSFPLWDRHQKNTCYRLTMDFYDSGLPKRSQRAVSAALNRLARYSHQDFDQAEEILERAIQNEWRGLYEIGKTPPKAAPPEAGEETWL